MEINIVPILAVTAFISSFFLSWGASIADLDNRTYGKALLSTCAGKGIVIIAFFIGLYIPVISFICSFLIESYFIKKIYKTTYKKAFKADFIAWILSIITLVILLLILA